MYGCFSAESSSRTLFLLRKKHRRLAFSCGSRRRWAIPRGAGCRAAGYALLGARSVSPGLRRDGTSRARIARGVDREGRATLAGRAFRWQLRQADPPRRRSTRRSHAQSGQQGNRGDAESFRAHREIPRVVPALQVLRARPDGVGAGSSAPHCDTNDHATAGVHTRGAATGAAPAYVSRGSAQQWADRAHEAPTAGLIFLAVIAGQNGPNRAERFGPFFFAASFRDYFFAAVYWSAAESQLTTFH